MQEREELVWSEVDVARDVLEPLGAETSLVLRLPHLGPALPFI